MLQAQTSSARFWRMTPLTGMCCAIALITSASALAADGDGGRKCRGPISETGTDPAGFPQPRARRSRHGVLQTTLHACISTNEMLDQNAQPPTTVEFHPPTFEGTIPGPTLKVKPGDRLSILLLNDLPFNPANERDNAFPNSENTLNLHTHGLTVSPLRMSDNIFREMRPGTTNLIQIDIPNDHPSGTFWYHVHKHGSVTYQFLGGMAGFLIVEGGEGTLDMVPEVAAAKDVPMAFQVIRSTNDGKVVFVNEKTQQFGTSPFSPPAPPPPIENQGLWSTYGLNGGPPLAPDGSFPGKPTRYSYTTNGIANPTLHMRPGEVQRWRLLNATDGDNLLLTLVSKEASEQGLALNVVAMDAITVPKSYRLEPGDPLVMGPGQRMDVMVKAGKPGIYLLQALAPNLPASVSPYRDAHFPSGIDPQPRPSRHSPDFPSPCPASPDQCAGKFSYPVMLATIEVSGAPKQMDLPADPLPTPKGLPSIDTMLSRAPDAVRKVVFEICGDVVLSPQTNLPSCGWYFAKYDATYWGGAPFYNLEMMRDADDMGQPSSNPAMPRINFKKEGLFDPNDPLFPDMIAGNYEEWTVFNQSFSDHPFHIHQNHVLVTKINSTTIPQPEWHDTLVVPASINDNTPGSITFRTYFNPVTAGCFVMHCHILTHEDIGMMQRLDILPAKGQPSGCVLDGDHAAVPLIERLLARRGNLQICSAPRQSGPVSAGLPASANLSNRPEQ